MNMRSKFKDSIVHEKPEDGVIQGNWEQSPWVLFFLVRLETTLDYFFVTSSYLSLANPCLFS